MISWGLKSMKKTPQKMNDKLIGIREACEILDVNIKTLRAWTEKGKIEAVRTGDRGHRKYRLSDVHALMGIDVEEQDVVDLPIAVYARVSSHDQKSKGDLDRQKARLLEYCALKKYDIEYVFDEVGSGMNDKRSKLKKLMKLASDGKISKVVIEHKDRLIRFNYNIILMYFNSHGVEVEYMDETLNKSFENELVEDMLTLMASFSAKIYGKRSHQNRKKKKEMENAGK